MTGFNSNNSILLPPSDQASLSFCDVDYDYNYDYDDFTNGGGTATEFDNDTYADDGANPLFDHSLDSEFNRRFNQSTSLEEDSEDFHSESTERESEGPGRMQSTKSGVSSAILDQPIHDSQRVDQPTERRGWGSPLMGHLARDVVSRCL